MDLIVNFIPVILTVVFLVIFLSFIHWVLIARHEALGNERKFPRQLILLGLTFASIIVIALVLPVSEGSRNQLIGLIGLLLSGLFAFSSTTVTANLMAGMLIRVTRPFRTGDFIRAGEHFGRVVEMGLFDTEIQSETSELIAIPNSFLISNPVSTVRSSGTIISASLTLGYDVHHSVIDSALLEAADFAGLSDPFVQVIGLKDHAIEYRVSGMLSEVKGMITARSRLYRAVLDTLHGRGIEIVSPSFMNQRRLPDDAIIIPRPDGHLVDDAAPVAESAAFDKAERAERTQATRESLLDQLAELQARAKTADATDKAAINQRIDTLRSRLEITNSK